MADDQYAETLTRIRARFAGELSCAVDSLDQALRRHTRNGNDASKALAAVHRSFLDLSSTGATVGFTATGKAAHAVEEILLQALSAKRALSESEVAKVQDGLSALRSAAQTELPQTSPGG
jgi:chemotaxis protein histidine kinase CheA